MIIRIKKNRIDKSESTDERLIDTCIQVKRIFFTCLKRGKIIFFSYFLQIWFNLCLVQPNREEIAKKNRELQWRLNKWYLISELITDEDLSHIFETCIGTSVRFDYIRDNFLICASFALEAIHNNYSFLMEIYFYFLNKFRYFIIRYFFINMENKSNENLMENPKKIVPISLKTKCY